MAETLSPRCGVGEGSGELRIDFGDEVVAVVPVNVSFENWQILMPDGEQWIGIPGGGVHHIPAS